MTLSRFGSISSADASYAGLSNYANAAGIGNLDIDKYNVDFWAKQNIDVWKKPFSTSGNIPDYAGDLLSSPAQGANASSFTFVTAPGQVQISQGAEVQQVSIFGSNNPPLTVAGRNSGELSLSDALMEGFTLGKQVQQPLENLYKMQEVVLDSKNGFVNVPVYTVYAGQEAGSGRAYGNYVIENIQFDEEMRDLTGKTTRARVSVTFRQVANYQINTGRDQATSTTGGQPIKTTNKAVNQAANQGGKVAGANADKNTPSTAAARAAAKSSSPVAAPAAPGSSLIRGRS